MHVADLCSACTAFSDSIIRYGTYNLGGGSENAASLTEIVNILEQVSGLQAVIDEEHPFPSPIPFNYVSDLSLIRQELGWKPEVSLEDGLITLFHS